MEIMAAPSSTLEITRTLASVTLLCVVLRVSALLFMHFIIFRPFQFNCKWHLFHSPGITFSFFWKNHEAESRFAVASGGKVISNGFSVFINPFGGYVEFYTRGNNHRWKANIKVPGTVNKFDFVSCVSFFLFFSPTISFFGLVHKNV